VKVLAQKDNCLTSFGLFLRAHKKAELLLRQRIVCAGFSRSWPHKQWPAIFNGDSTITSAVLDRLLHHAETVLIEGSSYRMKDRIET
jgi:DNA replication protein DnaC